jgi:hypothetical protein
MKKDQYIPHEVSIRSTTEVMNLIEHEGPAGYGIYWALMEYLRTQDDYTGDVRVLRTMARQLKTKLAKVEAVLKNYGLFTLTDFTFRSSKLEVMMRPLENKRKAMEKQNESKPKAERNQKACNSLKTNESVVLSKVKESKEEKRKVSTTTPMWEQYVDSLQQEQEWKDIMAMRTGLKQQFFSLYPRMVEHFKQHVRLLGNESRILSSSDAKHYFCFFLDPGSTTFRRMMAELQKPKDKGAYKYEDHDPITGQRSYCGVPIPADAPPRPNSQAVWSEDKWIY